MAIHDEVMPLMSDMQQLRGQLTSRMNGLDSLDQIPIREAVQDLQKGEDMMWDWMNQYKKPNLETDTARAYLEHQKSAINQVAEQMKQAIQTAKKQIK